MEQAAVKITTEMNKGEIEQAKGDIWIVYDAQCPLCNNYWKYMKLKETVGNVYLIDARHPSKIMDEITSLGINMDEGIVVKFQGKLYYGSDAVFVATLLSTKADWFNRLNYWMFSSQKRSKILYPICKMIRNGVLKLYNISKINNLKPMA